MDTTKGQTPCVMAGNYAGFFLLWCEYQINSRTLDDKKGGGYERTAGKNS